MSDAAETVKVSIRAEARQFAKEAAYQVSAMLASLRREVADEDVADLPWLARGVLVRAAHLNDAVLSVLCDDNPASRESLDELHLLVRGEQRTK